MNCQGRQTADKALIGYNNHAWKNNNSLKLTRWTANMPGRVTQHAVENKPSQLIDLRYIRRMAENGFAPPPP